MGMIFVPSVDGISHSPMELTLGEDVEAGADVLRRSVLATESPWRGAEKFMRAERSLQPERRASVASPGARSAGGGAPAH